MTVWTTCRVLAVSLTLIAAPPKRVSAQNGAAPDSAQRYAEAVNPIIDVFKGISNRLPIGEGSGAAVEFSAENLKLLNDGRARAEAIMNDPQRAYQPQSNDAAPALAACPDRSPYTCNPIGVPMRVVRMDPHRAFTNECSTAVSSNPPMSSYMLVDCIPNGGGMAYSIKRSAPRLGPELKTIVPTVIQRRGAEVETRYTGYRFLDPCIPCQ